MTGVLLHFLCEIVYSAYFIPYFETVVMNNATS